MRIDKTRIKLPITLQCCLLLIVVLKPSQVMVDPPDDVRAAVVSMLPEGDIMADVLFGKLTDSSATGVEIPKEGKVHFSIASDGRFFRFWADGRLPVLEATRIDLARNEVLLQGQQLGYAGAVHTQLDSVLKTGWRGHQWTGVVHQDPDTNAGSAIAPGKRYTLILGQLDHTGQTFLRLRAEETGDGMAGNTRFDMPLLF